jgi:FemAB-related protein (PEP-CTERM system-associated)
MPVDLQMDGLLPRVAVRLLDTADGARWDEFVTRSAEGTLFHLFGWRDVIESVFGYKTFYYLAERSGQVTGILPLTYIKSRLFGARLVSYAFAMYGGPVADDDESRRALEDVAERLMCSLRVPILEFRSIKPVRNDWSTRSDLYVTFRKMMLPTAAENLKSIPSSQRTIIKNRALRDYCLRSEIDDEIDRFYPVYAESVRNLGTPVYPRSYFSAIKKVFGKNSDIVTVIHGRDAVASSLNIYFRDEVMTLYVGGTAGARQLGGNVFMFWEVMRRACERGYHVFDFGRSKVGTGAYTFKRNWGFQPTPLGYQYRLSEGHEMPDLNPLNPKYRLLIETWKRLPLPVANLLGPPIVKGLG